jgi:hypothetical protein
MLEVIDGLADDPGREHRERVGGEDREAAQEEGDAVFTQIRDKVF